VATGIIAAVASPIDKLVDKAGKSKAGASKATKPRRKKASR
jgi:hypothetical protein